MCKVKSQDSLKTDLLTLPGKLLIGIQIGRLECEIWKQSFTRGIGLLKIYGN